MPKIDKKTLQTIQVILFIIALFILLNALLPTLTSDKAIEFTESIGILGPILVILFMVLSHILAPLSGSPALFVSLAVFGTSKTILYAYITNLISAPINFYISRKLGRKWVLKLVGEKTMSEIDEFAQEEGHRFLIVCRLLGLPLYDVVSYAAGLTKIKFKTYYIITAVVNIIPLTIFILIFKDLDFTTTRGLLIWLSAAILVALMLTFLIKQYLKRKLDEMHQDHRR